MSPASLDFVKKCCRIDSRHRKIKVVEFRERKKKSRVALWHCSLQVRFLLAENSLEVFKPSLTKKKTFALISALLECLCLRRVDILFRNETQKQTRSIVGGFAVKCSFNDLSWSNLNVFVFTVTRSLPLFDWKKGFVFLCVN